MKPTRHRPAKAACQKDSKPLVSETPRASRAPYVFSIYRETARAIENAAFSVPRASTADRPKLLAVAEALKDGIQAARLATIQNAAAACEAIPLAHAAGRFPAAIAWTRLLARVAPEQIAIPLAN